MRTYHCEFYQIWQMFSELYKMEGRSLVLYTRLAEI